MSEVSVIALAVWALAGLALLWRRATRARARREAEAAKSRSKRRGPRATFCDACDCYGCFIPAKCWSQGYGRSPENVAAAQRLDNREHRSRPEYRGQNVNEDQKKKTAGPETRGFSGAEGSRTPDL